jgi:general secretion pathway protein J
MRRSRGFTLVEVLVALAILLVVSVAVYRTLSLTFQTREKVTALNERYQEGRQVMNRLAREIRMSFLRQPVDRQLRETTDSNWVTKFKGEEDELYFATTAHLRLAANAKESDEAEVAYFLKSGDSRKYRGKTLYRRESKRIDDKPDKGGTIWPVIEGVKELKIEYWDDRKEIGESSWSRSWDSDDDPKNPLLPARVRITLVLESDNDRRPIRFVTEAAPKIRAPISPLGANGGVAQLLPKVP